MIKRFLLIAGMIAVGARAAPGQDTTRVPTGVELIGRYNVSKRPLVAVRPVEAPPPGAAITQLITDILQRDLQYSDRVEMGAVPERLATGPVDYRAWNSLNVVYLVTATLTSAPAGYQLRVDVHDVVYGNVKTSASHAVPQATAPNFRLTVHAAADEVIRAITGQPGIAATRVTYTRRAGTGYELMVVDYDGENVERVLSSSGMVYSPTWSPDGKRMAYGMRVPNGNVQLVERELASGKVRVISSRPVFSFAPAYSPDGKKLALTLTVGSIAQEIDEYDLERYCCLRRLTHGPRDDLNPSYSPDGSRIAFNSSRLGQLHVYVMSASGGEATLLTPYNFGEQAHFAAPDWSPVNDEIAFTGQSRGGFQIMIANAGRLGVARQITSSGDNQDPSWAPDGRHMVYTGVGRGGSGLYVIDTQTGSIRKLVSGSRLQMADWSPVLVRSGAASANSN